MHIHNGILLSCKQNSVESVLMRWMNLEPTIESEVSQKEKDTISYINAYMESIEMELMVLLAGQQRRCRQREQTCGHSGGGRGWEELRE